MVAFSMPSWRDTATVLPLLTVLLCSVNEHLCAMYVWLSGTVRRLVDLLLLGYSDPDTLPTSDVSVWSLYILCMTK